ncbi:hypothetical protein L1280_001869 [Deinococcus sp. HSC-46F16]|uniref:hypothetical protein n=1 Tax=Deinococcus sp. HSC-46F16 TaxID=2910968 RepID=UPI00209EEB60|nr:hypothetical protein [Deinococcus sp. HSC-46F16]MCP2014718.1 hypothetical protein [Deinococcus sp. HSC-46F16]
MRIRELPIIFSGPMVQKILAGEKTQTRRIIKPQPVQINDDVDGTWQWVKTPQSFDDLTMANHLVEHARFRTGDILWVKEAYATHPNGGCLYRADRGDLPPDWQAEGIRWRTPLFMPRRLSRLTLQVVRVSAHQIQRITDQDTHAEGFWNDENDTARSQFVKAWCRLNGVEAWDGNPWVLAIEFKRLAIS